MSSQIDDRLRLSPEVRSAAAGDAVTLLDLRSGKYFALSSTAALIWRRLESGATPAQIAALLQDRFDIPTERAATDVNKLLEQFVANGLILRRPPPATRRHQPEDRPAADPRTEDLVEEVVRLSKDGTRCADTAADLVRAFVTLVFVDLLMRFRGFGRIRRLILSCKPRNRAPQPATPVRVWGTIRGVDRAAAIYFKKIWCLQSSAACAYLLRRQNVAAQLVLGIHPAPFQAHAWVEIGGRPVHEAARDRLATLTVIDRW